MKTKRRKPAVEFTMKFDYTSPEGREAYRHAVNGEKYHRIMTEYDEYLRQQYKYNNDPKAGHYRGEFYRICQEHGISDLWDIQ